LTDKIHLQFKFFNDWDNSSGISCGVWRDSTRMAPGDCWLVAVEIVDQSGTVIASVLNDISDDWVSSRTKDLVDFQNVILKVTDFGLTEGCFHIKVTHQSSVIDPLTSEYTKEVFYSEPYEIVNCEGTMELEGTYTTKDFQNNIYSEGFQWFGTSNFTHRVIKRFRGAYERDEVRIAKTLNDTGVVTLVEKEDQYNYVMAQIPPYEVETLAIICAGFPFYVDGNLHDNVSGFKKNNEVNRMWRPKFTSSKKPDDKKANPASSCK
jgi:hypothetical protein